MKTCGHEQGDDANFEKHLTWFWSAVTVAKILNLLIYL